MEKPLAAANAGEGGCSGGTAFSRASSQRGGTRPGALILGMVRKPLLPGAVPAARLALGLGRGKDPCWKLVCSQRLLALDIRSSGMAMGFARAGCGPSANCHLPFRALGSPLAVRTDVGCPGAFPAAQGTPSSLSLGSGLACAAG